MQSTKPSNSPKQLFQAPNRKTCGGNAGLTQAYDFRDIAATKAKQIAAEPCEDLQELLHQAQALRCLAVVWSDASDRIRILRGKPLPGSLRPERKPTKKKPTRAIPQEQPDPPSSDYGATSQAPQDSTGSS